MAEPEDNPTQPVAEAKTNGVVDDPVGEAETESDDTTQRLEAAAKERDHLREEVTELRRSLESLQQKHEEEITSVNTQLEQTQTGKSQAETRYQKLLGQVNTIKTQLGERLKSDAVSWPSHSICKSGH